MLRSPVPIWLALVAILVAASVTVAVFLEPNPLATRPDFHLRPGSSSQTLLVGCHHVSTTLWLAGCINGKVSKIMVQSLNGFSGIVTLTAATPAKVNATLTGYDGNPLVILGSNTNDSLFLGIYAGIAGNFTVAITGTSGQLSHTVNVSIDAQDMTFLDVPNALLVPQGSRANMTITMKGVNGLHGNLTVAGGPISPALYGSQVLLFSPSANCGPCSGIPPPYPLPARGTVEAIVMATWQAGYSGQTGVGGINVQVPGLDGYFQNDFTIVFA